MNVFTAHGVVHRVCDPVMTKAGFEIVVVLVNVQDELERYPNIVPFSFRTDRHPVPDGLAEGDIVNVNFRLHGYEHREGCHAVKLTAGDCEVEYRAGKWRN